jgi:hypothetical protein
VKMSMKKHRRWVHFKPGLLVQLRYKVTVGGSLRSGAEHRFPQGTLFVLLELLPKHLVGSAQYVKVLGPTGIIRLELNDFEPANGVKVGT